MGITVHYKGKIKDLHLVDDVIDELKDISEIMSWKYTVMNEDWEKPNTAEIVRHEDRIEITGHLPLKGIRINPHPDCESLSILFDKNGNLRDVLGMAINHKENKDSAAGFLSVKTQFAPPEIHVSIIKLLKYLKNKYIPVLEVIDEGRYWDTEDKNLLIEKISFLSKKMDQVEEIISSIQENLNKLPADEAIKLLERTLREKLK